MTIWFGLWIAWLVLFLVIELTAVVTHAKRGTLTSNFKWLFAIRVTEADGTKHIVWRRMAAVAGWSILTIHLFTNGFI